MSSWRIVDQPFPQIVFKTADVPASAPGPSVDNAQNSPDQERALHKWVNDVRHWVNSGRAAGPGEAMAMLASKGCPNPEQVMAAYDNLANLDNNMELTETPLLADDQQPAPPPAPREDPNVMPTPPEQLTAVGQPQEDPNNHPVPPEEEDFYKQHEARMAGYQGQLPGESDADYFQRIEQEEAAAHNAERAAEGAQDHTHMIPRAEAEMQDQRGDYPSSIREEEWNDDPAYRGRPYEPEYEPGMHERDRRPYHGKTGDEPDFDSTLDFGGASRSMGSPVWPQNRANFWPEGYEPTAEEMKAAMDKYHRTTAYGGDPGHQGYEDGSVEPVGYPEWNGEHEPDLMMSEEDAYAHPEDHLKANGWVQMPLNQYHYDAPGPLSDKPIWVDPQGPEGGGPDEPGYQGYFDNAHDAVDHLMQRRRMSAKTADFPDDNLDKGVTDHAASERYPEHSHENAPDHSAEGHNLPDKVNEIYNAIMRENPEYGKEKAMKIAWERSGEKHEKGHKDKDSKVTVGMSGTFNGVTGKVIGRHSDVWGQDLARFSTENGQVFDVPFDQVTPAEPTAMPSEVEEIETFLGDIDQAGSDVSSITARIENLDQVVKVTHNLVRANKVSLADQVRLDAINLNCRLEIGKLTTMRKQAEIDNGQGYLQTLPQYELGAGVAGNDAYQGDGSWLDSTYNDMQADAAGINQDTYLPEQADLLTAELPAEVLGDQPAVQDIATQNIEGFASTVPNGPEVISKFVELVEASRRERFAQLKTTMQREASAQPEVTGPDDALFM